MNAPVTFRRRSILIAFALIALSLFAFAHELENRGFGVSRNRFFEGEKGLTGGQLENAFYAEGEGVRIRELSDDGPATGACVSKPHKAPFPMTELLPSWNVALPEACGFYIYMKVSRDGERWTPWLYLGRDGAAPRREKILKSRGVRVDVDYLLFDEPARFYQWKVVLYSEKPGASPALNLFSVCMGNSSGDHKLYAEFPPYAALDNKAIKLDVPYRSQLNAEGVRERMRGAICCPTSVAMVLEYHGVDAVTSEVCRLNFDRDYRLWGSWPQSAQSFSQYGFRSYVTQARSLSDLRPYFERGLPLVASIKAHPGELKSAPYGEAPGHVIALCGINEKGDVWVNDPFNNDGGEETRLYDGEEMKTVHIGRGGVIIVAEPRK